MNIKERILAIRLAEKIRRNPEYAQKIGVDVEIKQQQFQKTTQQSILEKRR